MSNRSKISKGSKLVELLLITFFCRPVLFVAQEKMRLLNKRMFAYYGASDEIWNVKQTIEKLHVFLVSAS